MGKRVLAGLLVLTAFVLHQDFWWKGDATLVFGFLPVSLAYHVGWTLLVALGWFWVGKYCWPAGLDATAEDAAKPVPQSGEKRS